MQMISIKNLSIALECLSRVQAADSIYQDISDLLKNEIRIANDWQLVRDRREYQATHTYDPKNLPDKDDEIPF